MECLKRTLVGIGGIGAVASALVGINPPPGSPESLPNVDRPHTGCIAFVTKAETCRTICKTANKFVALTSLTVARNEGGCKVLHTTEYNRSDDNSEKAFLGCVIPAQGSCLLDSRQVF
eukprot:3640714-Amphidinium_carterae.1